MRSKLVTLFPWLQLQLDELVFAGRLYAQQQLITEKMREHKVSVSDPRWSMPPSRLRLQMDAMSLDTFVVCGTLALSLAQLAFLAQPLHELLLSFRLPIR